MKEHLVEMIITGEVVATKSRSMSSHNLIVSLCVSLCVWIACISVFSLLRKRLRSVYEPRTFIVANHIRAPPTSDGFFAWLPATLSVNNETILCSSGLDAYFFLRYILVVMLICVAMAIPLITVLTPIHLTGNREDVQGFDKLSTINLSEDQKVRHVAHLMLCVLCTMGSLIFFKSELNRYFRMRARHILSQNETPGSASTLLIKGLNDQCKTEEDVQNLFAGISGLTTISKSAPLIKKIWFNKDYTQLHNLVKKRSIFVDKIERLELWLIERCLGVGESIENQNRQNENKDSVITGNLWREFLSAEDLSEMHGAKGSLLTWLKSELNMLNSQIYQMQLQDDLFPSANSCFVQFDNKLSSFIASRSLCTEVSLNSSNSVFDRVYPADIIWSNLSTAVWTQYVAEIGATFLNYLFVFGWAAPVAAITIMTQAEVISHWMPQVHWMIETPRVTRMMSGVLMPLLVSSLTSLIPMFFRFLARLKGFPTKTRVEMDVQKYLFLFMFFQLFLIVTLATGLPGLVVKTLVNTSEGAITLANSLPKATTFFVSYLMASCMTAAGNTLMQSQQLLTAVWNHRQAKTPRQKLKSKYQYSTIYWGSVFPTVTNVGAIAITYALISPLILLSAIVGLSALYVAFKYRILYCYVPRCVADGDYYPKAIFQLFSGFYCQQMSLLGTLLISRQLNLAVVGAVLIIVTAMSHHYLQRLFQDMSTRIPLRGVPLSKNQLKPNRDVIFTTDTSITSRSTQPPKPKPVDVGLSSFNEIPLETYDQIPGSPHSARTLICSPGAFALSSSPCSTRSPTGLNSSPNCQTSMITPNNIESNWASPDIYGAASIAIQETWMGLFDALASDFSCLTVGQQEHINAQLFEHPDRRLQRPCIWLPRDWRGVAQDQVKEMQTVFTDLRSSCAGAEIYCNGKIHVTKAPPDFDPLKIMKM